MLDPYFDEDFEPGPMDSEDMLLMGLRAPRCNGCELVRLRHELGDKFHKVFNTVYELDAEPHPGQDPNQRTYFGRPIRFHMMVLSWEHSSECYNWQPPEEE